MSSFPNAQISILRSGDRRRLSFFLFLIPRPAAGLREPRLAGWSGWPAPVAGPAPPLAAAQAPGLGTRRAGSAESVSCAIPGRAAPPPLGFGPPWPARGSRSGSPRPDSPAQAVSARLATVPLGAQPQRASRRPPSSVLGPGWGRRKQEEEAQGGQGELGGESPPSA